MKIRKILICILITQTLFYTSIRVTGSERNVLHNFLDAFMHGNLNYAKSLLGPDVLLPEIRENTPITRIQTLPSPHKNTKVLIGYFKKEEISKGNFIQRIAFIWEVKIDKNKISQIIIVADGSNPFMNEPINQFKVKYGKELLVPAYFPFSVTHVVSIMNDRDFIWIYKNSSKSLKIAVYSCQRSSKKVSSFTLKNKKEVELHKTVNGYQIDFCESRIHYQVELSDINKDEIKVKKELIHVVESMLP
ncbi:hypothetical protein [Bacillus sp. FJAT-49736]|uniref:hypothetical protein n=1 Tax=Bacillus sp. FJAT-49736 TaxID=2833582 RepID=UPI001BC91F25|nr:hypothetical protein [Bacillus sp. FJAT-49736]MBS4172911.1 hypothetical protein [Bacillus sp. FJAT-49736]